MSSGTLRVAATPEELVELMGQSYEETAETDTIITHCPAHDDHDPSLVVSLGRKGRRKGRLILYCRAGCSHMEVLGALAGMGIAIDAISEGDAVSELDAVLKDGGREPDADPAGAAARTAPDGVKGGAGALMLTSDRGLRRVLRRLAPMLWMTTTRATTTMN